MCYLQAGLFDSTKNQNYTPPVFSSRLNFTSLCSIAHSPNPAATNFDPVTMLRIVKQAKANAIFCGIALKHLFSQRQST